MTDLKTLRNDFYNTFNIECENIFFSPGRVNLIGEHTDYNGGNVFPCALSFGTYGLVSRRNDNKISLYSLNFKELGTIDFNLNDLVYKKAHDWANYPKGVIKTIIDHGYTVESGFNILIYGDIPNGAGLSSSASIEVLMAIILNYYFKLNINKVDIAKICQEAERNFIGVNCGIMDQFSICMGLKDSAILLDCNTLNYRYSSINMDGYKLIIGNTNKKRGLADSKYNERREECETALKELQNVINISSLGDLTIDEFEKYKTSILNPIRRKRAKHAVYENQRTLKAVEALEKGNLKEFGKLLNESHISLRDDYEVTGIELDTLVSLAWEQKDIVLGARMTGAGFGGCSIILVKSNAIEEFIEFVTTEYTKKIGYKPSFYIGDISNGARKLI